MGRRGGGAMRGGLGRERGVWECLGGRLHVARSFDRFHFGACLIES